MGINDMKIPRERGTFVGMMEHFFNAFTDIIAEEENDKVVNSNNGKEVHVHIHTGAAKKLDPNAKVRNRGKVIFPAGSSKVKDNKDHFPINDANQARNSIARVGQYRVVPPWYNGTLEEYKNK